jgi:predicted secreted protein
MVATSGMQGSLWVCATLAGTYVKIGELSDLKMKLDGKEIDTSNVDDAGWGSSIMGAKSWDVSATNNLILADGGYVILSAAIFSATMIIYAKIMQSGTPTVSPVGWAGMARVSAPNWTLAGVNTQQKIDFSLKGNGALAPI